MINLVLILVVVVLIVAGLAYEIGLRSGGQHWQSELTQMRLQAAQAERRLHDLTRQAFVSMAEAAERHHPNRL